MTAATRRRIPFISSIRRGGLSVRLGVMSAALATVVIVATFSVLSVQVRNSTRDLFARELARNGNILAKMQHDSRRQLVLTAALLSGSPTLNSAIDIYRAEQLNGTTPREILTQTVEDELRQLGEAVPGGTVLVTDAKGVVI